ncbi:site-specific integrase [Desulfobacterota bacterium AH_259_B03_O07]|nr:site-specific integrase [Desulfobacterota bacterium AH_259_B03_O07]
MGVFKRWVKSKDGAKTPYWYIRFAMNGRIKWESVGKVGIVTKTVAQRKLERIKRKIRMGLYEYEDNVTLESLEDGYIKYVKNTKNLRTWKKRKEQLRTLKTFFQDKTLNRITPGDIDDYKSFRLKDVKPASVNRELATLRHIFNLAKRDKKFYGDNPVSVSGLLSEDNHRDRILTPDEETRLMDHSAPHLQPILFTALNTGMRKGEILSLKWDCVDFDNNLFIITALNNKGKKTKRIPINSYLRKMILELKLKNSSKSEYVFLGDTEAPIKNISTAFNNACWRANIKGLRFHDLRHTAGTRMLESNVNIVAISEILGHSSIDITKKRYLHPDNSLRDAVEKLANFNNNCSKNCSNENRDNL